MLMGDLNVVIELQIVLNDNGNITAITVMINSDTALLKRNNQDTLSIVEEDKLLPLYPVQKNTKW